MRSGHRRGPNVRRRSSIDPHGRSETVARARVMSGSEARSRRGSLRIGRRPRRRSRRVRSSPARTRLRWRHAHGSSHGPARGSCRWRRRTRTGRANRGHALSLEDEACPIRRPLGSASVHGPPGGRQRRPPRSRDRRCRPSEGSATKLGHRVRRTGRRASRARRDRALVRARCRRRRRRPDGANGVGCRRVGSGRGRRPRPVSQAPTIERPRRAALPWTNPGHLLSPHARRPVGRPYQMPRRGGTGDSLRSRRETP